MTHAAAKEVVLIARGHGLQGAVIQSKQEYGVRIVHKKRRRWVATVLVDADDVQRELARTDG